jgi:hypothetical protein
VADKVIFIIENSTLVMSGVWPRLGAAAAFWRSPDSAIRAPVLE